MTKKLLFGCTVLLSMAASAVAAKEYKVTEWEQLIPESDLRILLNPPESIVSIPDGSEFDVISEDAISNSVEEALRRGAEPPTPEEQAYSAALTSTNINAEMVDQPIRIAGFVVPVEYNEEQVVTEFFLVPYFGACIHVPPPPPNQIIYVTYPQGLALEVLYNPFWVEGMLTAEVIENDLATAAYTLSADTVKKYEAYQQ